MATADVSQQFEDFLAKIHDNVRNAPDVVGLVGMGSTADRRRVDEWSDHDVALITIAGGESGWRPAEAWLPRPEEIALEVHEHHGGVKVVYDDGHVVEYGVADVDGLSTWAANSYEVFLDRGGVALAMQKVAAKPAPVPADFPRDAGLILALVLIGVGRARRGELLSANALVRGAAVEAFTRAVAAHAVLAEGSPAERLDSLDPTRRFEHAFPDIAARIDELLTRPVEKAAEALLELAVELFGVGDGGMPRRGLVAVTRRLGWGIAGT